MEGPSDRSTDVIETLVERAEIEETPFESRIEGAEDIEEAVLAVAREYDTICVGATRSGPVSQAVFGSLPETVGEKTDRTVVMARGAEESPMSIRQAVVRRLDGDRRTPE